MDKITHILENVVRCKYFEAGVHTKNPIENSYQDGLGKTTQTLDHVVVVHILIRDKRKSQIKEYSDKHYFNTSQGVHMNGHVSYTILCKHTLIHSCRKDVWCLVMST